MLLVDSIVTRTINLDFIYFDLLFLAFWIFFMIRKKYWIPILWGVIGWAVYLFVDYFLWYRVMHSRQYDGSINSDLFFLWFCLSAGFAQFSYVAVMLEKRNWREILIWTLFFYLGWTMVGILSQWLSINDSLIRVSRNMNALKQRLSFTLMAVGNFLIALVLKALKKITWHDVFYLFLVGTLVEMNLEFSLAVSGIRLEQGEWSFQLFIVNTLIEFNMGIVLMFLLWSFTVKGPKRMFDPMIQWKDRKKITTNFNLLYYLSTISESESVKERNVRNMLKRWLYQLDSNQKLYPSEQIQKEIEYVNVNKESK
ncbi:MAG: hypothetical protein DRO88_09680 [Promethearchaeia archaeon]|nr:MAG: hypothetical protein DRO88_09680 [Candidatus Lokiarchaeia archaeon]